MNRIINVWTIFTQAPSNDLWQPDIMTAAIVLQLLYLTLVHGSVPQKLYGKRHLTTTRQTVFFLAGCWLMYFSFAGPLDYLSDNYLFSAHMVQHMLEITIMTPLLLKGLPQRFFIWLLRLPGIGPILRIWKHPIVAGAVFNIVLTIFHTPYLYDLTLENDTFHLFEHSVFFVIASFMWAPLVLTMKGGHSFSNGQKLLYLLYNYNLMMPIVVLLLIARHPWYAFYVSAPRLADWLTPQADMQLGAVIMMIFMAGAFLVYGIGLFVKHDESVWYE